MSDTIITQHAESLAQALASCIGEKTNRIIESSTNDKVAAAAGSLAGSFAGMTAIEAAEVFCLMGAIGAGSPPLLAAGTFVWFASPVIASAAGYAAALASKTLLNKIL